MIGPATTKFEVERERWPGNTTVYRVFPSWAAALEAAGLPYSRSPPVRGTVAERVEQAREMAARGLIAREIGDHLGVSVRTAEAYLCASECEGCGAPVVGGGGRCRRCAAKAANPRNWTEQDLLAAARVWRLETGRYPTGRDWLPTNLKWAAEAPRWPTNGAVQITMGGFQELRLALDQTPYNAPWDRETAIAAINAFVEANGRVPKKAEWESGAGDRYPSSATLQRLFGGVSAALRAAGHEPAGDRRIWGRERIIEAIRTFEAKHGRPPKFTEWVAASPENPSVGTVVKRFGNFPQAIATARSEAGPSPDQCNDA